MKDEIIYNSLNENEAAVYIGMSRSFLAISRMEGSGEKRTPGPAFVKVGRRVIYLKADLDAWLAQHRVEVASTQGSMNDQIEV